MKVLRPQEIPVFVSEGLQDIGITGEDWVRENRADVEILQNLEYGKIRLVIAVPKSVPEGTTMGEFMESIWAQGKNFRISTEYLNIASEYLKNTAAIQETLRRRRPHACHSMVEKRRQHTSKNFPVLRRNGS